MANPLYQHYSLNDFDKFDCLKISKGVYLVLIYILRGYIVWLMSVTNFKDRVGIISWIYPETSLFYLSLGSGAIGVLFVFILSLRRPDASSWIKAGWQHGRSILIFALIFDCLINLSAFYFWQMLSISQMVIQTLLCLGFILFCLYSTRFNTNLNEFPEKLPEK